MLKIGDFSKLAMVSVRMLRYYDNNGILSPAEVDKFTGYRYYNAGQLNEMLKIKKLQRLGISLAEIKRLKDGGYSVEEMSAALRKCYNGKLCELSGISAQIADLRSAIEQMERNDSMENYTVELKTIPKRKAAALRRVISKYADEGKLWEYLYSNLAESGIKVQTGYPVSMYIDKEYKDTNPEIEVQVEVTDITGIEPPLYIREFEETEVASVVFSGSYEQISEVYCAMAAWMEKGGYSIAGNMFLRYITSPAEAEDASGLLSELCIPVKK